MKIKIFLVILVVLILGIVLFFISPQFATSPQKTATTPLKKTAAPQKTTAATFPPEQDIPSEPRFRVVWVQDMGDGRDVDAVGRNLRLMGLDTGDGRGERAILDIPGNYMKPLVSPRGDRVVYSDRVRKKVYIVNWDGSGLKELADGFGLALWRDPRDGQEWVYYGHEEIMEGGFHCRVVYRTNLDRPGAGELVWDKAPVNIDSFQLSADGRMAGGNLPWPGGGVANLPNESLDIFTKGCWPALATVRGVPHYWIFDGAHRNLTIFELQNKKRWQVRINGAPGIDGHEVYHPRWSNHPRIMAMTGPYTVGSGANRIAGGGREVEIHVGRFSADLTHIEFWWKISNNDRGDFYPDVWVAPAEGWKQTAAKTGEIEKVQPGAIARRKPAPEKTIKRLVVEARLTDPSITPTPQGIAPYRRALLVNGYEVVRVISSSYRQKKIMAAHWVIEDGRVIEEAKRGKGKTYRMVLEPFDDHPDLEGERLIMDSDEFKLPLYYELSK